MTSKRTANETKSDGKKFLPSTGFWPTKSGTGFSAFVTEEVIDVLSNVKQGGRLFIQAVEETNERSPAYRLVVFPPQEDEKGL